MSKVKLEHFKQNGIRAGAILVALCLGVVFGSSPHIAEEGAPLIRANDPMVVTVLPEELSVQEDEPLEQLAPAGRYAHLSEEITQQERGLLALLIYHESRGEPYEGQLAVCECVLNRYKAQFDGETTLYDIIYADGQFACAEALTTAAIREPECLANAFAVINDVLQETTYQLEETDYYFNTAKPNRTDYIKIGNHYFY